MLLFTLFASLVCACPVRSLVENIDLIIKKAVRRVRFHKSLKAYNLK